MRPRWFFMLVLALSALACRPEAARGQEELGRALARLAPVFGEPTLCPRQGEEDIYEIAHRYGMSASDLFNANKGDLELGDELLVIPLARIAPVARAEGVVVNLTERALYFYRDGRPVNRLPVATGMRGWETPTGDYTITNRVKNPTWFPPAWAVEEEPVPPGPENPLGDRWMGLSIRGYGIHATNAPWSVGRYLSHGCMRMYPEHARDLYELVKVGTPVRIVYARVVFGFRPEEGI
ncbi:MAG: L,D-transpeptidase, partial [Gemmatimonadota bacterium]